MDQGPTIDETLMKRAGTGHHRSFEALIRRYSSPLMTLIKRMIVNHHRSEEIFQDVVFSVWENRLQYEFPRPVRPWLFRIAINRCRAEFRKKSIQKTNQDASVSQVESIDPPEALMMATESESVIQAAVEKLSEQQRAVVILRIWNGMSYHEIADVVGVGESTVRSYMHHALKSLRISLEPYGL
jgi:RNA polymerase sigma-70 factor (family 1)